MFSGKTTEMIRLLRRYQVAKKRVLVLKKDGDVRKGEDETVLKTHSGEKIQCKRVSGLEENECSFEGYDVIGIDDGHFFEHIGVFAETMATQHSKIVIIAALDGDSKRDPFMNITNLISKCEKVTKLSAICPECSEEAQFSWKNTKRGGSRIEIGGKNMYTVLCRECWTKKKVQRDKEQTEKTLKKQQR